jgi:hypothetical protein
VQHDRHAAHLKHWIEMQEPHLSEGAGAHERYDDAATVAVELRRLHHNDEWNRILVTATITVNIQLRHQSAECSSAYEPFWSANSFPMATVASTAFDLARCAPCSRAT